MVWLLPFARYLVCVTSILLVVTSARAQESYELGDDDTWHRTDEIDPTSPEGGLATIRRALAAGEATRAENLASQWLKRHDRHPSAPEAYLLRGDALMLQRDYYEALFDYELIAKQYKASDTFVIALEREFEIAKLYARGTKRKLWGMRIVDASADAEELLIRIQERLPGSELGERAGMELGDFYFNRRDMDLAGEAYSLFIENYADSEQIAKARRRMIYAFLASFKGPEFDATGLADARTELRVLKAVEPTTAEQIGADALISRIDESMARKLLVSAKWYLRTGDPIAAEYTIRRLIKRYPRSVATVDALKLMPKILPKLPSSVLAEAPDYEHLRAELLGVGPSNDRAPQQPAEVGADAVREFPVEVDSERQP